MAKVVIFFDKSSQLKPREIKQVVHSVVENNVLMIRKFSKEESSIPLTEDVIKVKVFTEKTIFQNDELLNRTKTVTKEALSEEVEETTNSEEVETQEAPQEAVATD